MPIPFSFTQFRHNPPSRPQVKVCVVGRNMYDRVVLGDYGSGILAVSPYEYNGIVRKCCNVVLLNLWCAYHIN